MTKQEKLVMAHIAKGNKKLPRSTWIFNAGPAKTCPSRKLGLCQVCKACYADKAEKMYPNVLPYRRRQAKLWRKINPVAFAIAFINSSERARSNISFRYNESGDFANQKHVDWFAEVCFHLQDCGIPCYGYTARTDLDLSRLAKYSTVNCSNTKHNYKLLRKKKMVNRFKAVKKYSGKNLACAGDCRKCSLCQIVKGKTIEVEIH